MFDNPILFSLLISSIVALGYYMFNRENDKKNYDLNKNMKYILVFGIVFIICLIGKIYYSNTIEKTVEKVVSIGGEAEVLSIPNNNTDISDVGCQPTF